MILQEIFQLLDPFEITELPKRGELLALLFSCFRRFGIASSQEVPLEKGIILPPKKIQMHSCLKVPLGESRYIHV